MNQFVNERKNTAVRTILGVYYNYRDRSLRDTKPTYRFQFNRQVCVRLADKNTFRFNSLFPKFQSGVWIIRFPVIVLC